MTPSRRWLAFTLGIAAVLCLLTWNRGWEPVGEGAIAQAAERVLQGEVPHRDFDELYTGGLTYLHAAAFTVGGVKLSVLRVPLVFAALAWVAALFGLARRFLPPPGAALFTVVALVWSVPNDPSPMPSWYNLFFATFCLLALARWIETRHAAWLVAAGALGAASFLMKLSGLFLLIAVAFFLLEASRSSRDPSASRSAGGAVRALITLVLVLFVVQLWRSVGARGFPNVVHFVLPVALIAAGLGVREWSAPGAPGALRLRALARAGWPFALGAAAVLAPFAAWLAAAGALGDAFRSTFVTSFERLEYAGMQPPRPFWLAAAAPLLLLLRPRADHRSPAWRVRTVIVGLLLAGVLVGGSFSFFPQQVVWQSLRSLGPILGLAAGVLLAMQPTRLGWPAPTRELAILCCIVAVMHSLIQFPFAGANYFNYVAPLVLLAGTALVRAEARTPAGLQVAVTVFLLGFGLIEVLPGSKAGLELFSRKRPPPVRLDLPRGGLRVGPDQAQLYGSLVPFVQERAAGAPIWAGPDAPQLYSLGGFRNRTRALYSFLNPASPDADLPAWLERQGIRVLVINTRPVFTSPLSSAVLDALAQGFPSEEPFGPFLVRWR